MPRNVWNVSFPSVFIVVFVVILFWRHTVAYVILVLSDKIAFVSHSCLASHCSPTKEWRKGVGAHFADEENEILSFLSTCQDLCPWYMGTLPSCWVIDGPVNLGDLSLTLTYWAVG